MQGKVRAAACVEPEKFQRSYMAAGGARPVPEGARGIVWAATLDEDGPSGGFYRDSQLQAW